MCPADGGTHRLRVIHTVASLSGLCALGTLQVGLTGSAVDTAPSYDLYQLIVGVAT